MNKSKVKIIKILFLLLVMFVVISSFFTNQMLADEVMHKQIESNKVTPDKPEFGETIQFIDENTGLPLADYKYTLRTESGKVFKGRTDNQGRTIRVTTDKPEKIYLIEEEDGDEDYSFNAIPRTFSNNWLEKIQIENYINANNVWLGLTFTADGGKTWQQMAVTPEITKLLGYKDSNDNQGPVESSLMLSFLNDKRGWLSPGIDGANATWQTEDGGYTWSKQFDIRCFERPFFLADKKYGWFFPTDKEGQYVLSTDDGGITWTKQKSNIPFGGYISHEYFVNEKIGFAVVVIRPDKKDERITMRGIVKTENGGRIWKLLWKSTCSDERYSGIHFVNDKEGWIWSALPDSLYHTTDGGTTWEKDEKNDGLRPGSIYFVNNNQGWLLSSSMFDDSMNAGGEYPSLYYTSDKGKTWKLVSRKEIIDDSKTYFGPQPYFPNWNDGNMFLFHVKLGYLKG